MAELLLLSALPPQTTKGTLVRLLTQVGGLDRHKVGRIEVRGSSAQLEVPGPMLPKLVAMLDGTPLGDHYIRASFGRAATTAADPFLASLLELLELEGLAEAEQAERIAQSLDPRAAERAGSTLLGLRIRDVDWGLGGRALLSLSKPDAPLPWTRLSSGSPVIIRPESSVAKEGAFRAIVTERTPRTLRVACDRLPEGLDDEVPLRIDLSFDEVARRRQRDALVRASEAQGDRLAELRKILLGQQPARFRDVEPVEILDPGLNRVQQDAVAFALSAEDVAIVHGPPGTGKSTTLVEVIRQHVRLGQTVLACAPSNIAVDNLFERLLACQVRAVRLGHPARVLPELRENTLDLLVQNHPEMKVVRKMLRESRDLRESSFKRRRSRPEPGERRELRAESKQLIADARRLETQIVRTTLDSAHVLLATTTGLDSELLGQRRFDVAVIDEACQGTEPGMWIPVLRANKLILAGDHCQLPPTVLSLEAKRRGLSVSLQERLVAQSSTLLTRTLVVQYRMHQAIMQYSSEHFYEDQLEAHASVAEHRLCDLEPVAWDEQTERVLEFLDTAGAGYDEELEPDGSSRRNPAEADLVARYVTSLCDLGVEPNQIGVITPYAAQARLLRSRLASDVEVDSVDGFQGREKEAIIISLVRSNPQAEIGFLADTRRMNVALTRARRRLIVIGDSATLGAHPFYANLIEYFDQQGGYRSVWELN